LVSGSSTDGVSAVKIEKKTPAIAAVAIPLNVPMNTMA